MSTRRSALTSSHFGQHLKPDNRPEESASDPHLSWLPTVEKRPRDRTWEQANPAITFRGVPPELHKAVKEIAQNLHVNVDDVARAFLEYSFRCYELGRLPIEPVLHQKLTLFPEGGRAGWYEVEPSTGSPPVKSKKPSSKQSKTWQFRVSYRLPPEFRQVLVRLRQQKSVPTGELVTTLLDHALQAYRQGQLALVPTTKEEPALRTRWE